LKRILLFLTNTFFILCACTSGENSLNPNNPTVNKPDLSNTPEPAPTLMDSNLVRSNAYLDSTELLTLESYPLQFNLFLKGNLPTPCNQLRVDVSQPDSENKIMVDVYSVTRVDKVCAQVLQPFEENFPLGSFPAGKYSLWVNGQLVAEFEA
jgi:inhibitor of cysteine peptidase